MARYKHEHIVEGLSLKEPVSRVRHLRTLLRHKPPSFIRLRGKMPLLLVRLIVFVFAL